MFFLLLCSDCIFLLGCLFIFISHQRKTAEPTVREQHRYDRKKKIKPVDDEESVDAVSPKEEKEEKQKNVSEPQNDADVVLDKGELVIQLQGTGFARFCTTLRLVETVLRGECDVVHKDHSLFRYVNTFDEIEDLMNHFHKHGSMLSSLLEVPEVTEVTEVVEVDDDRKEGKQSMKNANKKNPNVDGRMMDVAKANLMLQLDNLGFQDFTVTLDCAATVLSSECEALNQDHHLLMAPNCFHQLHDLVSNYKKYRRML